MKKKLTKLVLFTSGMIAALSISNQMINLLATIKQNLFQPNGHFYKWRLGNIFYTKCGTGTPLLLIHDLNACSSAFEWNTLINHLSKKHTVYSIDLLGCGRSDKPHISYTNYLYIQLLADFTRDIIHQKTDVLAMGHSVSSVLMLCNMDNSLFHTIGLVSPEDLNNHYLPTSLKNKFYRILINFPILGTTLYQYATKKKRIERHFYKCSKSGSVYLKETVVPSYYESAHLGKEMGKYLYSSINSGFLHVNVLNALKNINNNVFILYGQEDKEAERVSEQYTAFNPSIEVIPVSNSGFYPQLDNTTEVCDLLDIYL